MKLYKHKRNTDVAMCIMKAFYVKSPGVKTYYKPKVRWFSIVNPANIFDTGIQENLKIDRNKLLTEWELIR